MFTSDSNSDDLINELLACIERLELNETVLQQEVSNLQQKLNDTEQQLEAQAIAAEVVEPLAQNQQPQPILDRYLREIHIGDTAETLTKGAYKERRGTVCKIELPWIYIIDKTGQEQRRIPSNLKVLRH